MTNGAPLQKILFPVCEFRVSESPLPSAQNGEADADDNKRRKGED